MIGGFPALCSPFGAGADGTEPVAKNRKVLPADDDPTTLRLVGHALRKMGRAVVAATDGAEAGEKFLAEWFPVVVAAE